MAKKRKTLASIQKREREKRFVKFATDLASRKKIFEARAPQNGNKDSQSLSKSLDSVNSIKARAFLPVQRYLGEMLFCARMVKACTFLANSSVRLANTSNRLV